MATKLTAYEAEVLYKRLIEDLVLSVTEIIEEHLNGEPATANVVLFEDKLVTYLEEDDLQESTINSLHLDEKRVIVHLDDGAILPLSTFSYEDLLSILKELEADKVTIYSN